MERARVDELKKLKITYIFHSGFVVETDSATLIFDCWLDPAGVVDGVLRKGKPTYVFASHFHEDHFCHDIFGWRDKSAAQLTYILSKDILRRRRASREEADVWMGKGAVWTDGRIGVWATGSTDVGVSWIVEVDGKRVFHAGDLNNWYARFLSEPEVPELIHSVEFGVDVSPVAEEKRFLGELKDIAKVTTSFDVVMFPIDARIGNGYTRGGRQFIERFEVGMFVPMHFEGNGVDTAWRMEPFCTPRDIGFWRIGAAGDVMEVN